MKAYVFSLGTRGDIEPFLAIAELLKSKNWEVLCVFPEQFRAEVELLGLSFEGFDKKFLELMEGEDAKRFMGGQGSVFKRLRYFFRLSIAGIKLSKGITNQQQSIQSEGNPDRIIYHPKCNSALIWGMANPGRSIMVSPIPFMAHPINYLTVLGGNYGKLLNRLSFWVTNTIKAIMLKSISKQYRKENADINITFSSIRKAMLETEKTFYTISPSLFPRPDYWPAQAKVVGYYERNKTIKWQPGENLTNFLSRYEKIVFITFGSMSNSNPKEKTRAIIEVIKKHNIPAIINTSWGGLEEMNESLENVLFVNDIPYDWIFPRMYAIVHHGGSGTTHTALKYGCPSLIVPHILDQFYWSRTISDLHLGPEGVSIKNVNEKNFEEKLLDLLNNPFYKRNAEGIAEKMKGESDVEKLYDLIIN